MTLYQFNLLCRILASTLVFYICIKIIAVKDRCRVIGDQEIDKIQSCRFFQVIRLGVSQVSGGSSTGIGGYADGSGEQREDTAQFEVNDHRTLDQVIGWLCESGYVPSFCTACYREGRTGDRFMSLAKAGQICNVCQPNALMTLKEYQEDYASAQTAKYIDQVIEEEVKHITNEKVKTITLQNLDKIAAGERDFRF